MKSINNIGKKRGRGRPATDATPVLVRLQPAQLGALDGWIKKNDIAGRPEAIRRLVEIGLKAKKPARLHNEGLKDRAREMAGKAIDKMSDDDAHADDQASRKRRLLKGPEEFREVRIDRKRK